LRHFWKKSDRKVIKEKKPPLHNEKKVEALDALKSPTSPAASITSKTPSKSAGLMSLLFCCAFTPFQEESNGDKMLNPNTSSSILDERTKQEVVQEDWEADSVTRHASEPNADTWLLPPIPEKHKNKKCLVLDMDETLIHSSFKEVEDADFVIPIMIDNQVHNVYVLKRPGVDNFMRKMGEIYEIVVFTASLATYADPVLDHLDIHKVVDHRLFRESCCNHMGNFVKDLSRLGRELPNTIIIDNSPASYIFHNENAIPVSSWFNDPHDTELTDMTDFLTDLTHVDDVRLVLDPNIGQEEANEKATI